MKFEIRSKLLSFEWDTKKITTNGLIVILGLLGIGALLIYSASLERDSTSSFGNLLLISMALTMVGLLVGILFGIPKSPSKAEDKTTNSSISANTNLEEVSDWLTKILIGFGIAELSKLDEIVTNVTHSISTMIPAVSAALILGITLYFPIYGFLAGWLLTRIYLTQIFARLHERLRAANNDLITLAKRVLDDAKMDANNPTDLRELKSKETEVISKVLFLEENGQKIDGQVYNKLGLILLAAHNYGIALEYFRKGYESTKDPKYKVNMGSTMSMGFQKYEKAIEIYLEVLKDHKLYPLAHYNLACAQTRLNRFDEALKNLGIALEIGETEFKEIAKQDSSFLPLKDNEKFKELVPNYSPTHDQLIDKGRP